MDHQFSFANRLFDLLMGGNYGIPDKSDDKGKVIALAKPDLFAMSFVYNPKNIIYLKASVKKRMNKIGADHSSAALLENAIGDD